MPRTLALPPLPAESADGDTAPSKTQLKQAMHDLQALGLALTALGDERLAAVPMPESLHDAVREYKRTRSHEGRRRQLQYIGKLMRKTDPAPIREAVAAARLGQARESLALHAGERWRDELIADDEAVARWMRDHPRTDAQQLRALVRSARQQAAAAAPARDSAAPGAPPRQGRAYRELYRFLQQQAADDAADASGVETHEDPDTADGRGATPR